MVDRARLEIDSGVTLTHAQTHQRTSDQRFPATLMFVGVRRFFFLPEFIDGEPLRSGCGA